MSSPPTAEERRPPDAAPREMTQAGQDLKSASSLADDIDAARRREREAAEAAQQALRVSIAASEASLAATEEVIRLDALCHGPRHWALTWLNPNGILDRPLRISALAQRSKGAYTAAELAPVLDELTAEGLIVKVGSGYMPRSDETR
jgi:hypothetical protein